MRLSYWYVPSFWIILFIIEIISMRLDKPCHWILALVPTSFMIYTTIENAIIENLIDNGTIVFEEEDEEDETK